MIRARADRWFDRFRRTGDPRLLAKVFDHTAPELCKVAAHLCRDRHAAEDAVQGAFLAALEQPQRWDAARPLLPWLLGLLANIVRENRRRASRTPDPQRLAAAVERDPAALAGEAELGATFDAVLARLDEPYRTAVELHLVHGRAAHEIAAELGVPAGTVRMRLHRGLDRLRQKLPQGFAASGAVALQVSPASLDAMRAVVLAKLPGGFAAAAAGSGHAAGVLGVLLMKKSLLCVLAAALAVVCLWIAWPALAADAPLAPDSMAIVATTVRPLDEVPVDAAAAAADETQRTRAPSAPVVARGRLRVVLRNASDHEPVANAGLYANGGLPQVEPGAAVLPEAATANMFQQGTTDAAGTATFELPPGFVRITPRTLAARAPWYAQVFAGRETEVVLDVPVAIAADVRVVDADGRAVPGARIVGHTQLDPGSFVERELGRTDAAGNWRRDFVEVVVTVRAIASGLAASGAVELREQTPRTTLCLGAAVATLTGTVSTSNGAPIADTGVLIGADGWTPQHKPIVVRTDAHGRYECDYVPAGPCTVLAWRELGDGHRRFTRVGARAVAGARTIVDVRFSQGASVMATLRGGSGKPLASQHVAVVLREGSISPDFANFGETDERGRCVIDGIMPGQYEIQVHASPELVRQQVELIDGQQFEFERMLGGTAWVELLVMDEARAALPGCRVQLLPREGTVQHASVSADGRARFEKLAEGTYTVEVREAPGLLPVVRQEVVTNVRTELTVPRAARSTARLRGTLFSRGEIAFDKVRATLMRGAIDVRRANERIDVPIDPATGTFESPLLPAGVFHLQVTNDRTIGALRMHIEVRAGDVVDLGRIEIGTGSARFLVTHGDGSPVRDAFVAIAAGERSPFVQWPKQTRENGVELTDVPQHSFDVLVWGADIAPVRAALVAAIGECATVPIVAARGTPVTVQWSDAKAMRGLVVVTVSRAGAVLVSEAVAAAEPYVRGLLPGSYRAEVETTDGRRGAVDFAVGAQVGDPVQVQLSR